jgi:PAS domain S-box-containing protein
MNNLYEDDTKELSGERFKSLFDYSANGIAIFTVFNDGENFIIKDMNPAAEHIDNLKKEDVVGKMITEVYPSIAAFSLLTTMRNVHKTGKSEHHPVGKYADSRITGWRENYVFKISNGEIVDIYYDKTGEKIAEQDLIDSEEKFSKIFRNSPDPILLTSVPNGMVIDVNDAAVSIIGLPIENIIGKTTDELGFWETTESRNTYIRKLYEEQRVSNYECKFILKHQTIDALISGEIVALHNKSYFISIIKDISELKKANRQLKESEAKFKDIAENISEIVMELDKNCNILFANKEMYEITGYNPLELIGKNFINYLTSDSAERCKVLHTKMILKNDNTTCTTIADFISKSGDTKILSVQWKIVFSEDNEHKTYLIARDITMEETIRRHEKLKSESNKENLRKELYQLETKFKTGVTI